MFNELSVKIGIQNHTVFFKGSFLQPEISTPHLHKHNYAEIHIITGGNATYIINDRTYTLKDGSMLVIPRDTFHCCTKRDEYTMLPAFQVTYTVINPKVYEVNKNICTEFLKEIEDCKKNENYSKISSYISIFCSNMCTDEKLQARPITDYAFLIYEFFSTNYSQDVKLADLADILHLSERQTERLVIEHTGKTFKEEITSMRMEMAQKLINAGMPLTEIAQYVGYKSYAGFYKAIKKCKPLFNS